MVDEKNAITDIFKDKDHLVTFSHMPDLKDKIMNYLDNPQERERIASAGREEVLAKIVNPRKIRLSSNLTFDQKIK